MDNNLVREKKKRLIITFETTTAPLKLDIKGKAWYSGAHDSSSVCYIGGLWSGMACRAFRQESLIAFMKEQDIRWEAMYELEMY